MEVTKRTFVSSRHISPYPVRITTTFEQEFDHLIDSLGIANVRMSLFALKPIGWNASELLDAARRAFSRFSLVGLLADGTVAVLYLGPRPSGMDADQQIEDDIVDRLSQALCRWTIARTRRTGGRPFEMQVAHRWSDQINCAADMIDMLQFVDMRGHSSDEWTSDTADLQAGQDRETALPEAPSFQSSRGVWRRPLFSS